MDAEVERERGRESYARREWSEAYEALSSADRTGRLDAEDVELLGMCAWMLGREDEYLDALERAYQVHLDAGESERAVRCAFWLGVNLARRGEMGRAGGWLGRAQRVLEQHERDCVERGYLLMPAMFQQEAAGDWGAAATTAATAGQIGERFGDRDLFALSAHTRSPPPIYGSRHGRRLMVVSVRGAGCSGGNYDFLSPQEAADGVDVINWITTTEEADVGRQ